MATFITESVGDKGEKVIHKSANPLRHKELRVRDKLVGVAYSLIVKAGAMNGREDDNEENRGYIHHSVDKCFDIVACWLWIRG